MRVALTAGAYSARSIIAAAQRQVNLFTEPLPAGTDEEAPAALYPTPGLRTLLTMPQGPIRGIHTATSGAVYVVAGAGVYSLSSTYTATLLGSITAGRTNPVSMADNGIQMVVVDGSRNGWTVTLASNAFAQIVDSTGSFTGADRVDYLDTYFLFNVPGTPQFRASDSLSTTFDPLYFANKESYSDLLVSLVVAKREIWLLGSRTSEVWANVGAADFPFQQMGGVFIDRGCAALYSPAETDNAIYWLEQDRYGQGIVIEGAGYQATRVSTYAIEAELTTYPTIADAIGFTYQLGGHVYYALTFPTADKTWCYDITTKRWHEWVWCDSNGAEHRHRANCITAGLGQLLVGDWQTGKVYALDPAIYTDDGAPIKRSRAFPHLVSDGKRIVYRQFLADMETGRADPQPIVITLTAHRYWRIYITAAQPNDDGTDVTNFNLNGIAMAASVGGANLVVHSSVVNGAVNATSSSHYVGWTADDSWLSADASVPAWWAYDFTTPVLLAEVRFACAHLYGYTGPSSFALQYSDDNSHWTTVGSYAPASWDGSSQAFATSAASSPSTTPVNAVSLSWSDDGGKRWSSPIVQPMGDLGEYLTSMQYQRLGMGRRRVFRLEWSLPCATALQGAWIDFAVAQS